MTVNARTELPCKSLNLFALALLIGMTGAVMRGNAARATAFGHESLAPRILSALVKP